MRLADTDMSIAGDTGMVSMAIKGHVCTITVDNQRKKNADYILKSGRRYSPLTTSRKASSPSWNAAQPNSPDAKTC